ncbi:GbsR/MarR family transcriptional regulator [Thermanaerothrix sp.]|jgi:DNA-binding transcriptional regulator GbsR (MarR family)|uniref:GbsR/MarR family transcriptional regulator n=1 Tax=Thermanaerothrix sp. TaxID=2972675 RepID=UPI002ADDF56B|nr:MarR family transcriptional regulator [Thermanaerothrix sp.]
MTDTPEVFPNPAQRQFIESMALALEAAGLPRLAGRCLAWLLICEPPTQSLGEIATALSASKGAVSQMVRLLAERGLIERVPTPHPRRDYYRFKSGGWATYLRQWLEHLRALHALSEQGLALLAAPTPESQQRLLEAHDLFSALEARLPAVFADMEAARQARQGATNLLHPLSSEAEV